MRTNAITPETLQASIIAVPPLARDATGAASSVENAKILAWLAASGVSSFMYGGNANIFHMTLEGYARALDVLIELAPSDSWLLPSFGPDFGKAMAQAPLLKARGFPTAMMLPSSAPNTSTGLADGARRLSDALGKPLVIYLKTDRYIAPADLAALTAEGRIAAIKYAVVREDPLNDGYLREVIAACGTDLVVSGVGERPSVIHWRDFGLRALTSGSICVGARAGAALFQALRAGDFEAAELIRLRIMPLEDLRDAHSPILVLHAAVEAAKIASTGPIGAFLSNLEGAEVIEAITSAATALRDERFDPQTGAPA